MMSAIRASSTVPPYGRHLTIIEVLQIRQRMLGAPVEAIVTELSLSHDAAVRSPAWPIPPTDVIRPRLQQQLARAWPSPGRSIRPGCGPRSGCNGSSTPRSSSCRARPTRSSRSKRWSSAPASRCAASTSTSPASTSCSWRCSRSRCGPRPSISAAADRRRGRRPLERAPPLRHGVLPAVPPAGEGASRPKPADAGDGGVRAAAADVAPDRGGAGVRPARDAVRRVARRGRWRRCDPAGLVHADDRRRHLAGDHVQRVRRPRSAGSSARPGRRPPRSCGASSSTASAPTARPGRPYNQATRPADLVRVVAHLLHW